MLIFAYISNLITDALHHTVIRYQIVLNKVYFFSQREIICLSKTLCKRNLLREDGSKHSTQDKITASLIVLCMV